MRKNSLTPNKGLSLSTAQSISNLCNQRASEIVNKLGAINNYSTTVSIGDTVHTLVKARPLPADVVLLISEKAELHACQAFLMENLKAKDAMLQNAKKATADISSVEIPERPKTISPLLNQLPEVKEEWGWEQLSTGELNEYLEAEAFASHIGQFIHKDSILANLREELPKIPDIDWMEISTGVKSPVTVITHHTSDGLLKTHEQLAELHRKYESRVNYFKSKVKNLTTAENARIAKHNADAQNDTAKLNNEAQVTYETASKAAGEKIRGIQMEFEKTRQENIKEIAAMRIGVDARFQKTIDLFLKQLSEPQE